ncbi:type II toxin-antitoxin system death-on-curing family toxin [Yinghuangia sp. ASG 101]|uniref:type II toxin-antitoxin system death-on-curing family toxin n=1 Tax=Yinghuangia sp. ASG 101 TaxID=2896848 RepID=UPI001E4F882A|nr:type II toxin-antitoxin system death-on-curing family toxin [Yinghuangia sp. ASG 101]UGQ14201.1 type II toxin-antitoxin system death-on-curing family toxin [Yinghuangia sp. ASG 101]
MTGSAYLLTAADVIAVAEEITGNPGVRDIGLIESAVARPGASAFGVDAYPDLWLKAAALLHSIVANHPFIDGNKRTGLVAGVVFLARNGVDVGTLDEDAAFDLVIDIAKGVLTEVDEIGAAMRAMLGVDART